MFGAGSAAVDQMEELLCACGRNRSWNGMKWRETGNSKYQGEDANDQ